MPKDACYKKAMKSYGKWSARAAQATPKAVLKKLKLMQKKLEKKLRKLKRIING